MKGKIAITGGGGFVGTNLVRELYLKDQEIVVIDDFSTGLRKNLTDLKDVEIHDLSINNSVGLSKVLKDCPTIVHLAAVGSVPRSIKNPNATFESNIGGTINVMNIARETGAHVIFSSSSSVYGRNTEMPKQEKMWMSPKSPYAASKLAGEAIVLSYADSYSIAVTPFRFFNIFGPWQRPNYEFSAVIPKWIWAGLHSEDIQVFGNKNISRDFTYVRDVTKVLIHVIEQKISFTETINLAFGNRISLGTVISLIEECFPKLRVEFKDTRPGDVSESQNDPAKLRELIPTISETSFDTAFRETLDWYRQNRNYYMNVCE